MSNSVQSTHLIARRKTGSYTGIPGQLFPTKLPFKGLVRAVKGVVRRGSRKQSPALSRKPPGPANVTADPSFLPPPPSFAEIVCEFVPPVVSTGSFTNQHNGGSTSSISSPPSLVSSENSSLDMSDYPESMKSEGAGEATTSTGEGSIYEETNSGLDSEPMFTSPPTVPVYIEPEVPDPFLIDDSDDSDEDTGVTPTESQHTIAPAADEVPLAPTPASPNPFGSPLQSPNRNKDVPPPPQSDSDEEDAPELYLPGLCIPTMFLPIPNTDPLTTLLNKYIHPPDKRPVRDLSGEWQRSDFHTLVMSNSWRALARMARDRIVTSDPEDLTLILGLWYLRLSSLARLRLFNQTTAECTNLFSLLNAIEPVSTRTWLFERILPFELEVMHARLKYWAGDHMGYVDALYALLRKCKVRSRRAQGEPTAVAMWKERGARICLIIASQFMEMKDFAAAAKLLEPLCEQGDVASPALRSAVARIYLQSGNLAMAAHHFKMVGEDPDAAPSMKAMNASLLTAAEGDWAQASEVLATIVLAENPDNYVAVNNLCVALLSQGKLKEGIEAMEKALKTSPESVVAEPFLFNLSTLYELRSATAIENKRNLLIEVAKWSGDGLKTTCLKMPTT
ncbi:Trafficking protein particle complex subunit 12 [Mycena venus]|uniref:Trafficking protein particle complex subunit 12 n=1 Tax=Mycena venus TaxID=2733690 RepID=A0A8H6YCD0_9AGAR|nr:Trafficking protein particle complex subunit 12 [Mycena venus]